MSTQTNNNTTNTKRVEVKLPAVPFTHEALNIPWAENRNLKGKNIIKRTATVLGYLEIQNKQGLWLNYKSNLTPPQPITKGIDEGGRIFTGVNFSSQDYLALASHPGVKKAGIDTITEYGVHSAGSPAAFGRTKYTLQLATELANFLGFKHGLLYSTGWLAGYGVISGLVRPYDHIIIDRLAHNCLMEGSFMATRNVHFMEHLNNQNCEEKILAIRKKNPEAGIMVVTEGLFSMDSDTPNLKELQAITKKHDCIMLLDIAHDFGCLGDTGRGQMEVQGLEDKSNIIIIGAGSKVLATNLGYIATDSPAVIEYLKVFSTAQMFTNAVSPIQAGVGLKTLEIVKSDEGKQRRKVLMENVLYLRKKLIDNGFTVYGVPSPVVPLVIGNEYIMRITARILMENGVIVNPVEFPAVPRGTARYRLQIMASHTKEQIDDFVDKVVACQEKAKEIMVQLQKDQQAAQAAQAAVQAQPKL